MPSFLRTGVALGVAVLAIAASPLLSSEQLAERTAEAGQVQRALQKLATVELGMSLLVDAETGQRGYLLTGDPAYLAPYREALTRLPQALAALRLALAPAQVAELDPLVATKLGEMRRTIALVDAGRHNEAVATVVAGAGQAAMGRLRAILGEAAARERAELQARSDRQLEGARRSFALLLGADVVLLLLALAAGAALFADLRRREAAERAQQEVANFQRRLIEIVSHDVRSPLTAILATAQAELRRAGRPQPAAVQADHLRGWQRVAASVRRIDRLIAQLIDFTHVRIGGGLPVVRERADFARLIEDALEEARAAWPDRTFARGGAAGPIEGEWDPERIRQLAGNLLSNAVKHGDPAAPIAVRVGAEEQAVELSVTSGGAAIAPGLREAIFEPYRQGEVGEQQKKSGLGLGLYICAEIASAHGGAIDVQSSAAGNTFTARLPRHAPGTPRVSPTAAAVQGPLAPPAVKRA